VQAQAPLHWLQLASPQGLAGSGIDKCEIHYTTEVVVDVHFYTMNDSMMHPYNKEEKSIPRRQILNTVVFF